MKSRWTTYLLLLITAIVWGIVIWKILRPAINPVSSTKESTRITGIAPASDGETLRCDYPDPFLKNVHLQTASPTMKPLPSSTRKIQREQIRIEHLGTIVSGQKVCYIVTVDEEQYELHRGESAHDFTLTGENNDSLYFEKQGLKYGVIRCNRNEQ